MALLENFFHEDSGDFELNAPRSPLDAPRRPDESRYEGSEGYFMLHGKEAVMPRNKKQPGTFSKWDRTLTLRVRNTSIFPGTIVPVVLFGSAGQAQPTVNSEVTMPDLGALGASLGQNPVRNEIIANPFTIKGLRMIFHRTGAPQADFQDQIDEPLVLQNSTITGKLEQYFYQTINGQSPTTITQQTGTVAVIDFVDFKIDPERNFQIQYNMRRNISVFFVFTLTARTENSNVMFDRNTVSKCGAYRPSGNPLGDIFMENRAKQIMQESDYSGIAQHAFAPRPTGNPVADIELLNQPGS